LAWLTFTATYCNILKRVGDQGSVSLTDRGDIFAGAALTMILVAATLVLLFGLERITARAIGS